MSHPYDDYDRCLSDTYEEMLKEAENQIVPWIEDLVDGCIPCEFHSAHAERMKEDIMPIEFMYALARRINDRGQKDG